MKAVTIKPCPRCSEETNMSCNRSRLIGWQVKCDTRGRYGLPARSYGDALRNWNRRK